MLQVYGASASPFVRKVLVALEYKGVPYEAVPVTPFTPPPNWAQVSPLGKIPVLVHDALTLPDSSIICRYIEDIHPEPPLYPADPADRARANWLEEFADTRFTECVAPFFFERFVRVHLLKQAADETRLVDLAAHGLPAAMDYLEGQVPESGLLYGDTPSIADIAIVSPMINGMRVGCPFDEARHPRLMRYFARVTALPVFVARAAREAEDLRRVTGQS